MIAITRSKCRIPISDIFFADNLEEAASGTPLCFFQQSATPHPAFKPVQTSIVDLTASIDEISGPISKNTRYKIQRAEREGFAPRLVLNPTVEEGSLYANHYDCFAKHKGLPPCNRAKLHALSACSALLLSSVSDTEGNLLSAHASVKDAKVGRVRLLYSASHYRAMSDSGERNKIGRANRLLHWYEILTLKNLGFKLYDLGGIPLDSADQEKNAIAQFKLEFGGKLLVEYSGLLSTNLLGKIILPIARRRL